MTSPLKTESNRLNATRSTGPRTPQGKAISARNALRHGLLAEQAVLPDEDPEAFTDFSKRMACQLAPEGPLEEFFVDRITSGGWRLRRVGRLEASVIGHRTSEAQAQLEEADSTGDPLAIGLIRDATGADSVSKLSRYERSLERGVYRALHELQRLQAARQGEHVLPPAVLDVEVSSNAM